MIWKRKLENQEIGKDNIMSMQDMAKNAMISGKGDGNPCVGYYYYQCQEKDCGIPVNIIKPCKLKSIDPMTLEIKSGFCIFSEKEKIVQWKEITKEEYNIKLLDRDPCSECSEAFCKNYCEDKAIWDSMEEEKMKCLFEFKGEECNYQGTAVICNKTLVDCRMLENSKRFGGFPGLFKNKKMIPTMRVKEKKWKMNW